MKILISTIGTFHYVEMASGLAKLGHDVTLISGYPRWKLKKKFGTKLDGFRLRTFPFGFLARCLLVYVFKYFPKIIAAVDAINLIVFDIVAARMMQPVDLYVGQARLCLCGLRRARYMGAKTICDMGSSHIITQQQVLANEYAKFGLTYDAAPKFIIKRELMEYSECHQINVCSKFAYDSFVANGIMPAKITNVPLGVDTVFFTPGAEMTSVGVNVLFVGGKQIRKGLVYLIRAFEDLKFPNSQLLIVGVIEPEFESIIGKYAKSKNIVFIGHKNRNELRELMRSSSVMALPSIEDGFGMVILEALATGCPVVASTNTGGPDVIEPGKTGLIVSPANSDDLREALKAVIGWHKTNSNVRTDCAASVKLRYDWSLYSTRYLKSILG